jgi:hypothetical protein
MTIYEQELKLKDKLKEELIYINQNNLKRVVAQYEEYTDNLLDNHFNKRVQEIRQLEMKKNSIESKKIKEKSDREGQLMQATRLYVKEGIKFEFEKLFNDSLRKLQDGIDDIFNMDGIDRNIKSIYNSIMNNEFSVEKINENHEKSIKKFEELYKQYLIKNMKYKEELQIYNKRQEQILNENIDCKKDYNDINNYLNNFKVDNKEKESLKKLDNLVEAF